MRAEKGEPKLRLHAASIAAGREVRAALPAAPQWAPARLHEGRRQPPESANPSGPLPSERSGAWTRSGGARGPAGLCVLCIEFPQLRLLLLPSLGTRPERSRSPSGRPLPGAGRVLPGSARRGAAAMRAGLALGLGIGLGLAWLLAARRRRRAVREVLFFPSRPCCTEELLAEAESRDGRPAPCPCPLPRSDCSLSRLLRRLLAARRSLELCLFAFSSPELGRAVCVLHRRGVRVRVVTDSQYMALRGSQIGVLRLLGELCFPVPGPAGGTRLVGMRCVVSWMDLMREGPLGLHTAVARPCSPVSRAGLQLQVCQQHCAQLQCTACMLWHRCCQMQVRLGAVSGHVSCAQLLAAPHRFPLVALL